MAILEYLSLYSTNCKKCGYLDEAEPQKFERCHFTKGNTNCPASEIRIVITGKASRLAAKCHKAKQAHDSAGVAEVMLAVSKTDAAFKDRFYNDLESLEMKCAKDRAKS